ncbi:MAG: two-component regulator propeller domain-containing protein [Deltaproteobacteria bacterium]|nr:two-component regulator propeller domain-containing protein [Deltaproteobacteria bacterium]
MSGKGNGKHACTPAPVLPRPKTSAKAALQYLRFNARRMNVEPDRILFWARRKPCDNEGHMAFVGRVACILAAVIASKAAVAAPAAPADAYAGRDVKSVDGDFPTVGAIAATPDGFLWLGGQTALWRFDGSRFERKTDDLGEPPEARRFMVSHDGSLWIATGSARLLLSLEKEESGSSWRGGKPGLVKRSPQGIFLRSPLVDLLPNPWVWAMAESANGRLWFGTEGGLLAVNADGSAPRVFTTRDGLPNQHITAITVDGDKTWIGTIDALSVIEQGKVRVVLERFPVATILARPNGRLFVGGPGGAAVLDNGVQTTRLKVGSVNCMLADEAGKIWIGTVYDLNVVDEKTLATSLPLERTIGVMALGRDRDDGLWVFSAERGLLRMTPTPSLAVAALHRDAIFSVLAARDGTVWAVTIKGVVQLRDGQVVSRFALGREIGTWSPRSLAQAPDDSIILVGGGAVARFSGGVVTQAHPSVGQEPLHPDTVFVDRNGDAWLPRNRSGVARFAGSDFSRVSETLGVEQGLCEAMVGPMAEDARGVMWFGTRSGLGRWDPVGRKGKCFTRRDGLPGDEIAVIYARSGSVLVGSTQPVGLGEIRGEEAHPLKLNGPVDTLRIFGVNEHEGRLWFTSDLGVYVSPPAAGLPSGQGGWRQITAEDGLPSSTSMASFQPSLARTPDGRLWIPTLLGLGVLNATLPAARPMPRVVVEEVRVGGRRADNIRSISLSPGNATFAVTLAAPNFAHPDELMFETRMEGLETGWSPRGSGREIAYAGLAPGRYAFAARLVNRNTGTTGKPIHIPVVAVPWWWQTLWFKVVASVVLASVIATAFILRGRRIRAQFLAIAQERARIARDLHDGLAQGFTSITLFVDSAILELQKQDPEPRTSKAAQILGATKGIIDQCHREVRQAVFNLRAQEMGRVSVEEAIARVIDSARKASAVEISFVARGKHMREAADARLEQELPMVVQEAISNALSHGKAEKITVKLENMDHVVRLEIHDNGHGISDEALGASGQPNAGFGLVGMTERAARVGGKLTVQRAPEGGTTVSLTAERNR